MTYTTNRAPVVVTAAGAGETPDQNWFRDLASTLNAAHAFNTAQVINQGWPDGGLSSQASAASNRYCMWRIPVLGDKFDTLSIEVEAQMNSGAGVAVRIQSGNDTLLLTFGAGRQRKSGSLTVPTPSANTYVTITMDIVPVSNGTGTVYGINAAYNQIGTSGLDDTRFRLGLDGPYIHPCPQERFSSGVALSSYHGLAVRESIQHLTRRPRSLVTWSGVPSYAQQAWPMRHLPVEGANRGWIVRNQLGNEGTDGRYYHVHLRASASANSEVWVQIVDAQNHHDAPKIRSYRVAVFGGGLAWYNIVVELPETGRIPTRQAPSSVHAFTSVSLHHNDDVSVQAFSMWGE